MYRTESGILLPKPPSARDVKAHMKENGRSLVMGIGVLLDPDGGIAWQDEDWQFNALHDAGEQDMLSVYLTAAANPTKYLGLLNDAAADTETKGTVAASTEMTTPGSNGYSRQQILTTDWTNDGLISGDYRFSAAEKTFGPITTASQTATHSMVTTTASTSAGLLLVTLALSATTTIAINQSFKYILRWTQQ